MRGGHRLGLLEDLHADQCRRNVSTTAQAVPVSGPIDEVKSEGQHLVIAYIEWCEDCGAADWEPI